MGNNIDKIKSEISNCLSLALKDYLHEIASNGGKSNPEIEAKYVAAVAICKAVATESLADQTPFDVPEWGTYLLDKNNPPTVAPDARNETPIGVYDKDRCLRLFNEYLKLLEGVLPAITDNLSNLMELFELLSGNEPYDHPFNCWAACEVEKYWKKARPNTVIVRQPTESCKEFVRRSKQIPRLPTDPPPVWPLLLPDRKEPFDYEPYLSDPGLLEELAEKIRRLLKELKEEHEQDSSSENQLSGANQLGASYKGFSSDCKEPRGDLIDWANDILPPILDLLDLLDRLQDIYNELKSNCWAILRLEREFENRQIGRFDSPATFFEFLKKWMFGGIKPNTKNPRPSETSLSDSSPVDKYPHSDHKAYFTLSYLGNKPNRIADASQQYKDWLSLPTTERSFYPPLKTLFPIFDTDEFTDEDVFLYFTTLVLSEEFSEFFSDYQDLIIHLSLFANQQAQVYLRPDGFGAMPYDTPIECIGKAESKRYNAKRRAMDAHKRRVEFLKNVYRTCTGGIPLIDCENSGPSTDPRGGCNCSEGVCTHPNRDLDPTDRNYRCQPCVEPWYDPPPGYPETDNETIEECWQYFLAGLQASINDYLFQIALIEDEYAREVAECNRTVTVAEAE